VFFDCACILRALSRAALRRLQRKTSVFSPSVTRIIAHFMQKCHKEMSLVPGSYQYLGYPRIADVTPARSGAAKQSKRPEKMKPLPSATKD
jgi:hypothetical protein